MGRGGGGDRKIVFFKNRSNYFYKILLKFREQNIVIVMFLKRLFGNDR